MYTRHCNKEANGSSLLVTEMTIASHGGEVQFPFKTRVLFVSLTTKISADMRENYLTYVNRPLENVLSLSSLTHTHSRTFALSYKRSEFSFPSLPTCIFPLTRTHTQTHSLSFSVCLVPQLVQRLEQ